MPATKLATRIMALILFLTVICACADSSVHPSSEMLVKTADSGSFVATGFLAGHQPPQFLTEAYDNAQIPSLCFEEKRELAGRRCGVQAALFCGQELSGTAHLYTACIHTTASGKGHLSVLALSLGGNSPPIYHA